MRQIPLSIAIIARDEERHIGACLQSLAGLPGEVLVLLDDRSRDGTDPIARAHGATVRREPWRGFPAQRNLALRLCRGAWVLFIDADERLSAELRDEIAGLLAGAPEAAGYEIPRRNLFFGQALRGGGWYPDYQLRLLRRAAADYDEAVLVHEAARLAGPRGRLRGHLVHYNIEGLREFYVKQSHYARAEAETMALGGRRARLRNYLGAPARELWRRYVGLGGWRDGPLGLFLCASLAWFEVVKFAILRGLRP